MAGRPDAARRSRPLPSRRRPKPNRRSKAAARRRGRLVGGLVALVMLVGVLFVAAAPIATYRTQRAATSKAEADLADVQAKRARVERASKLLESDAEIERRAREKFGYQRPGEETFNLLPAPSEPLGLPDQWPFAGLERVLAG